MTFLTRTIAGGGESQASLLLVERGGSKYRPMQDEDISENVHLGLQNNSKSTTRSRTTSSSGSIRNEESDNVHTKKTTDPTPSSPSSSLSSSWSSSFEASSARSFQPHHQQQQQPKKQEQQRHHRQQQQSAFSSPFSPKTSVAKRLDESAVAAAAATFKQVNRSADLVPLTHEYDKMKRRLRSLIASTKQYHDAMARMHRARMEVSENRLYATSSLQFRSLFCFVQERLDIAYSFLILPPPPSHHFFCLGWTGCSSSCSSLLQHSASRKDWWYQQGQRGLICSSSNFKSRRLLRVRSQVGLYAVSD
jgi:hypothetical protein